MSAPAYASSSVLVEGTSATLSLAVPSGVVAGDLVLATVYIDGADTIAGLPDGWAVAPDSPVSLPAGGGRHSSYVAWKRTTTADTDPYVFTLSGNAFRVGAAHRFTGVVASGSPWNVTDSALDAVNGTASPTVAVTTTQADALLVWVATNWGGGPWTPPTGYTERLDSGIGLITMADQVQAVAGATGDVSGTSVGADKRTAWLGALLPVVDTPPDGDEFMNLGDVMDEVAAQLATIPGLRTHAFPPDAIYPPTAVVGYPSITFDGTYDMDRYRLPVALLVGKVSDRGSRSAISVYADSSGAQSIKAVLESGTYTAFHTLRVESAEFEVQRYADVDYLACVFSLDLVGSGGA